MESKALTIVIVTFKSDEKVINCLNSISNEIPIIIVENSNNKIFKSKIERSSKTKFYDWWMETNYRLYGIKEVWGIYNSSTT